MKSLMMTLALALTTLMASEAMAAKFVAKRNFGRGGPVITLNGGRIVAQHPDAFIARRECEWKLSRYQGRTGRNPNAACVRANHLPLPPRRLSCVKTARRNFGRGALLLSRQAFGPTKQIACQKARTQCRNALQNLRWRTGRYPNARCN